MTRAVLLALLPVFGVFGEEACESTSCQTQSMALLNIKRSMSRGLLSSSPVQQGELQLSETKNELTTLVQKARQQSMLLSASFAAAAADMPQGATQDLFKSFQICGQCNSFKRFGEANDGGYLMCMDGLSHDAVRAAYSLGVEHHDQWSEDVMTNLGVPVNQFDCTVEGSGCQECQFFKKCIVSADGQHPVPGHESEGWTLQQALSKTGQGGAGDGSLLMKMDIESSEWPIYASEPPEVLKKFGELIVEFHNLQDEARHEEYSQAMRHIQAAGLKVAHLHGNNYDGVYQSGGSSIPKVLEVTFVQSDSRPDGCLDEQRYDGLDAPNRPGTPELAMAHMS
jgi:hypothetical protein